ncbi:hypothetical protein RIF29_40897 [Crotalaria pallida]|uniref:Vacuolar ATPase assembly integral membrane protein VMA21 homolog n=1 Tax=Crotalaria pallida TaxID=3830 RepID=A0AAN9E9F2_CROPI
MRVFMHGQERKTKALKVASGTSGVYSVAIEGGAKDRVVVIGEELDAARLTKCMRKKVGHTELVSVEEGINSSKLSKMKVVQKFVIASLFMWAAPFAILHAFNHHLLPVAVREVSSSFFIAASPYSPGINSSKLSKMKVVQKFVIASLFMWAAPFAILHAFNHHLLPGTADLSPYSMTLVSGFLAVISVNMVIAFYIYLAMREPADKHEPDPRFVAEAKDSVKQFTGDAQQSSQPSKKEQ